MGAIDLTSAAGVLLRGIVDYAGLFPPASLPMGGAVRRYAGHAAGADAWMLGGFVVPALRLEELERAAGELRTADRGPTPWRLCALGGSEPEADADAIAQHAKARDTIGRVGAVETKPAAFEEVPRLRTLFDSVPTLWLEIRPGPSLGAWLDAIRDVGAGAKLRTGGIVAEAIPASVDVARFLLACAHAGVPFKATAGLHHAIRGRHRLTGAPDSPSAVMHGFLNVFLAAALADRAVRQGDPDPETTATLVALLDEDARGAIEWHRDHVRWRAHRFESSELDALRLRHAYGFGSCSFDEPAAEAAAATRAFSG